MIQCFFLQYDAVFFNYEFVGRYEEEKTSRSSLSYIVCHHIYCIAVVYI